MPCFLKSKILLPCFAEFPYEIIEFPNEKKALSMRNEGNLAAFFEFKYRS